MHRALFFSLVAALSALSLQARPNFSGRWELDKTASDFTKSRPVASMTETVDHREPSVTVDRMVKYPDGDSHQVWKLRTDGSQQSQVIPEASLSSRSKWVGDKLVTDVADDSGNHVMTEVREIDSQGRMVVTTKYQSEGEAGEARAVFTKK